MRRSYAVRLCLFFVPLTIFTISSAALAQQTVFTYQGRLADANNPSGTGNYDMHFKLFDTPGVGTGTQQGATITKPTVAVSSGIFTVTLDFGSNVFTGAARYLEIGVRPAGNPNPYTLLDPRQPITSTPYAIQTINAVTANALSSACSACVQDSQINSVAGSKVSGTIPVNSVPQGSGNYIQNTSSQQASANFNISGNGTLSSLNINGPFSLGGISPPAVAPSGQGRVYFDSASNKLKVSESGGAFINLVGASGVSGSGTTNSIPLWTAGTTLGNSVLAQSGGNVGIGTTTPQTTLDIRGSLTLEAGSSPGLFTGTGNTELNRYLALLNSPTSPSASGLKAGGILVSDSYSFANPGKNDLIVKGNVGIGTAPSSKLTVQTPTNNYGLTHTDGAITLGEVVGNNAGWLGTLTNHQLNLFANNLPPSIVIATNGNVGIGTPAPSSKVEIAAQDGLKISGFQPFLTLLDTNGGNKSSFMQGVNGDVVLLTNSRAAMVVKDVTGNVTIGTTSTSGKLTVDGGTGPAVWGNSTGGAGVYGSTSASNSAGVVGEVTTGASSGVFGRNTSITSLGAGVTGVGTSGPGLKAIGSNLDNDLVQGHTCVPGCSERFHITSNGTYVAGSDFAEALPARGDKTGYEPGDVLIVSTEAPGSVEKASQPYDARVAGVFSTRPGMLGANKNGATRVDPDDLPVAIVGVVPTKVSTENGAVQVGDLLTTSSTPGYAMRCSDRLKCIGAIVGKAMEPLKDQKGVINVLVTLR